MKQCTSFSFEVEPGVKFSYGSGAPVKERRILKCSTFVLAFHHVVITEPWPKMEHLEDLLANGPKPIRSPSWSAGNSVGWWKHE